MPDNKKILFLPISGRQGASSRYRVYDFLPYLEKAGFEPRVIPPDSAKTRGLSGLLKRRREEKELLSAAAASDVVFIQKRLFGRGFISRLKGLGKSIVFDFDDAIFTSPSGDWSYPTRLKVEGRLKAVLGAAGLVITGNGYLADYASRAGSGRVEVLPTAIELERYTVKQHSEGPPVLGWIGSSVNHRYLDMLTGVLPELSRRMKGIKLLVVSDRDYRMEGVEVENRRWSEVTEVSDIMDMDIGLMPLEDNEWTRGKCALKALQYMACGIPAVCSPVGANNEVVEDGVDGYLPRSDSEWVSRIDGLANSPEKRAELGLTARKKVESNYSIEGIAKILAELVA